jgi:hypothetical protein
MKAEGAEQSGSQSYVPQVEKDDRALKEALDLLRHGHGRGIPAKSEGSCSLKREATAL